MPPCRLTPQAETSATCDVQQPKTLCSKLKAPIPIVLQRRVRVLAWITEWVEAIWKAFRPPKRKRLELRLCTWTAADKLIREGGGAWTVAAEDDHNMVLGCVWLERLEQYPDFSKQQSNGEVSDGGTLTSELKSKREPAIR